MSAEKYFRENFNEIKERALGEGICDHWFEIIENANSLDDLLKRGRSVPELAYLYANEILKETWPLAEEEIATEAKWAYYYAVNVINGPWKFAEEVIATCPTHSFFYAKYGIKGRFHWVKLLLQPTQDILTGTPQK